MFKLAGMGGALEICEGVGGAVAIWPICAVGAGVRMPVAAGGGAGAMGCIGLGLTFFWIFCAGGGPEPFNSPLLTKTRSGRPKHLIEDKYFFAFDPARSSNSLGVSHSSPNWIHFPLLPDSYFWVYITAVVLLQRTFITGPMRGVDTGVVELEVGVLVLLPPLLESFMPF